MKNKKTLVELKDTNNHPLVWKDNGRGGKRILMQFGPNVQMSIINDGYGKESGLLEVAVFHKGYLRHVHNVTEKDGIAGYLTAERVQEKINKLAEWVNYQPVQINEWD